MQPPGHSYSGPTAAFAYMHLDAARVKRIFVLGPSHHVYLKYVCLLPSDSITLLVWNLSKSSSLDWLDYTRTHGRACAVSGASVCETPVGDLQVRNARNIQSPTTTHL